MVFAFCETACNYPRNSKNEADKLAIVVTYQGTYTNIDAVLQLPEMMIYWIELSSSMLTEKVKRRMSAKTAF